MLVDTAGIEVDFKVMMVELRIVAVDEGRVVVDLIVVVEVILLRTIGVGRTIVVVFKTVLVVSELNVTPGAVDVLVLTVE
jgi:hypothetical protein